MFGFDWAEEKLPVPYLTLPYLLLLELGTRRVGCLSFPLSLSYHQTDKPPIVRVGTTAPSIYTVVPYLADSVVQKTGYYFFLSFLLPFRIQPEYTESVVTKKTNQPTNQPVGLTAL